MPFCLLLCLFQLFYHKLLVRFSFFFILSLFFGVFFISQLALKYLNLLFQDSVLLYDFSIVWLSVRLCPLVLIVSLIFFKLLVSFEKGLHYFFSDKKSFSEIFARQIDHFTLQTRFIVTNQNGFVSQTKIGSSLVCRFEGLQTVAIRIWRRQGLLGGLGRILWLKGRSKARGESLVLT